MTAAGNARVGQTIKLTVELTNPLNVPLTNCSLAAQGHIRYTTFKVADVAAKGVMKQEIDVMVDRANYRDKIIMFTSAELQDVDGHVRLDVVA